MICLHDVEEAIDKRAASELLKGLVHHKDIEEKGVAPFLRDENKYYPMYAGLAALVKPKRILEIGSRFGYSLFSMIKGHPEVEFVMAVDNERMYKGSQAIVEKGLEKIGYKGKQDVRRWVNSHYAFDALQDAKCKKFDLVHIDGAHDSLTQKLDVWDGWRMVAPGGILVCDDTKDPKVREAVEEVRQRAPRLARDFYVNLAPVGWWVGVKR